MFNKFALEPTFLTAMYAFFPVLRRKKRASEEINFKEEHVVILSQQSTNNLNEFIAKLFVLDPTSSSLVPDKALSTKNLEYFLEMISADLPFPVKIIDGKPSQRESTNSGDEKVVKKEKSKDGLIAGVIIALLVVFGLVIAVFLYTHKQRQKRY